MAFTDILGDYAANRFGDLQNRFDTATGLLSGDEDAWRQQMGLETEEERRKRKKREEQEAANNVVHSTEVKTYEDGSQTQTTTKEIPAPVAPTQPEPTQIQQPQPQPAMVPQQQAPTPVAPVAPMAAQPQPQPQPQMAPQPQAAPAAPVAPGPDAAEIQRRQAVTKQMIAQQQAGGQPAPAAPQMAPQAAAPVAPPPMAPLPQPGPGVQVAGAPGAPMPQTQPAPTPISTPAVAAAPAPAAPAPAMPARTYMDDVAEIAQDPVKLFEYAGREDAPREGRLMAAKLAKQHMTKVEEQQRAEDIIRNVQQTGDTTDLEKILRSKREEGSYLKAILFARLGLNKLADEEQSKLGAGNKWLAVVGPNGERALINFDANGLPTEGLSDTGKQLNTKDLAKFGTYAGLLKGANVGGQIYRDPGTGQTLTKVDTQQGPIYYNKAGVKVIPKGEPVPLTAGSDISTQLQLTQMRRQQQFVGQTANARLRAYQETNNERAFAGFPPLTPEQMGINARGELIGQPQPGMPPTPPAPGAPGAPAPQMVPTPQGATPQPQMAPAAQPQMAPQGAVAPTVMPTATGAELRAQRLGREKAVSEVAKAAGAQVAASADTQNMLNSIDKIVTIIDSGNTNLGHAAGGLLTGEITGETAQRWGERLRTQDARNTKLVMDTVNKLASDGLKVLGSNPSTADLEFWTKFKPDINSDPAFVKEWLQSRAADLKRRLGYAEQQTGAGGVRGAAPAVTPDRTTTRPTVSNW